MSRPRRSPRITQPESYDHPTSTVPLRPDVGTQAQFKKKKPPERYRYDSSLSPALDWDGQNPAREQGEAQLAVIRDQLRALQRLIADLVESSSPKSPAEMERLLKKVAAQAPTKLGLAEDSVRRLIALGGPFLNWAGKAERLSFDVPTLPLFVHERLSTKAIIETLTGHRRIKDVQGVFDIFADPRHSVTDQVLKAYEHQDPWVNRMVLGDALVVMNSLLHYESLAGQVQMIYMDPPYGVKFGSNFQPFVRKRDVKNNDDDDLTREPEMVQAYRDTWELGLHSYLTYLRDRLLLCRELLTPTGSIFVQMSDENVHHVRELMDEVFGAENYCAEVTFVKTYGLSSPTAKVNVLPAIGDYLLWYAKDIKSVKFRQPYVPKQIDRDVLALLWLEDASGNRRRLTLEEKNSQSAIPRGVKLFRLDHIISQGFSETLSKPFQWNGKTYSLKGNHHWKTTPEGLKRLTQVGRLMDSAGTLRYVRYVDDFPVTPLHNYWDDTGTGQFTEERAYVVQTPTKAVARCLLMTTDPGDLVLDPTCGSGTTAYVAEQWGRRWITIDVSRVPLALARQRLLTATFPWYQLKDEERGPAGGFIYKRKQNRKGEEIGGIVPHITLKSIANNELPDEEVLVDRPEIVSGITRVSGPFTLEATIPTPVDWDGADRDQGEGISSGTEGGSFADRMVEILRKSPVLRLEGNKMVTLHNIRPPAKTLSLSAEALVQASGAGGQDSGKAGNGGAPVAFVFGPENGAVSEKLVYEAAKEAAAKSYTHLYVIGFAIQPNARALVEKCAEVVGVPATYVQATPDLLMGDLLKNMRSSQIFSVCGLPEVELKKLRRNGKNGAVKYRAKLLGLDVFDPVQMTSAHKPGNDVPAWLLDADYNGLCFHVSQAFFPRTAAWDNLRKALKGDYDESVWDHLAGAESAPFEAGEHGQIAVKVIDDRGNELVVVKDLQGGDVVIRRVRVQGFKRFDDVTFELPGHIVVAGPNNCGKTTLLQAVASWAYGLETWRAKNDFQKHGGGYSRVPIARPNFYPVSVRSLELLWSQKQQRPLQIDVTLDSGPVVAMQFEYDSTEQLYVRPRKDVNADVLRTAPLNVSYVPAMTGLGIQEPRYQPPKIAQLLGQGKPGDVIRNLLVEASDNSDAWEELKGAIRRLFGYEILSPDAAGADIVAQYRERPDGPTFDIASAGSGFQQVLMLLTFLHVRPGSVLLLDEPDAHLHVLLQDAIYSELRMIAARRNSRLIIATHSEVFINSVAPEELCMLLNQPRLLASTAERQRLTEALAILTNLDLMLVESAPGVLFTEDATDLEMLREWARVLNHPVYPALEKGILWKKASQQQREGASGISAKDYFDKLRLVRDDLPGLELLDRDGNPHLPATQITGRGLQRLRWNRYEIESYLYHPAALGRYVEQKVGPAGAGAHVADLQRHFQDNMPPRFLQNPFENSAVLLGTKARTDLLPPALNAAGLPGIPYTSYSEIASLMLPEEIHPEVKDKLDQIQKAFNL